MNIKKLNKDIQKLVESEPDIGPVLINNDTDSFHDEIYLGTEDGKYGIYKELNDDIRRDGTPVWSMRRISRKLFDSEREAKEWLAKYLLNYDRKETIENYIKNGIVIIYDNDLKSILGLEDVQPGKRAPEPSLGIFSRGSVGRSADPVPSYALMPKGPQRNIAKRDYMKLYGKPYEYENFKQLNIKLKQLIEDNSYDSLPDFMKSYLSYMTNNAQYTYDLLGATNDEDGYNIVFGVTNTETNESAVLSIWFDKDLTHGIVSGMDDDNDNTFLADEKIDLTVNNKSKEVMKAIDKIIDKFNI